MKSLKMLVAAVAVCAMAACTDNTPKQLSGVVVDASMNNVVVRDSLNETYDFVTTESDKTEANGLLIGSPIVVDYVGKLANGIAATKIATDATYNEAVGSWTMIDPIDSTKVMGVEIDVEGVAKSINMATLVYNAWELQGDAHKIVLKGQSLGNDQTIDFTETGVVGTDSLGKAILSIEGKEVVYTKAE